MPRKAKYTIDDLRAHANLKKGYCLSDTYIRNDTEYKWKCELGHIWPAQWANIKRGRWCHDCFVNSLRFPFFKIEEIISKYGGFLLTEEKDYVNSRTPIRYKCANNHEVISSLDRLRRIKKNKNDQLLDWCVKCRGYEKWTISRIKKEIAPLKNLKLLSEIYINNKALLHWECKKCNDEFWMNIHNMTTGNQGCKNCSSGFSERRIRVFFEYIFHESFPRVCPDWLINEQGRKLELDGYNERLKIAFEYQGPQHSEYDPKHFHKGGEHEFIRQQENDLFKKIQCQKMGVLLLILDCNDGYSKSVSDSKVFKNIIGLCKKHNLHTKRKKPIKYQD